MSGRSDARSEVIFKWKHNVDRKASSATKFSLKGESVAACAPFESTSIIITPAFPVKSGQTLPKVQQVGAHLRPCVPLVFLTDSVKALLSFMMECDSFPGKVGGEPMFHFTFIYLCCSRSGWELWVFPLARRRAQTRNFPLLGKVSRGYLEFADYATYVMEATEASHIFWDAAPLHRPPGLALPEGKALLLKVTSFVTDGDVSCLRRRG